MINPNIRETLEKNKYRIVGKNSAVKVCKWTKKSLREEGVCWKELFYNIKSHRCCQMSPSVVWCENQCMHCWTPIKFSREEIKDYDGPKEILDKIIKERKELLMGFKSKIKNLKKFEEALIPTLFTFSLSGEPTLYPKIREMIREIRKRNAISFLVTNGLNPEKILELKKQDCLPTQLVISLNASNEKLYKQICRSSKKDAWKKLNQTLGLMGKLKCRTVVRLTLIKELNMNPKHIREYAKLIKKANPLFIHVKGYVALGSSKENFGEGNMPSHKEVKDFAIALAKSINYNFIDDKVDSRVVLLGKSHKNHAICC